MAAFSRLFTRVLPYERSLTKGTSRTEGAPAETTDGMMRRENKVIGWGREGLLAAGGGTERGGRSLPASTLLLWHWN